jgi:hypothetical protein
MYRLKKSLLLPLILVMVSKPAGAQSTGSGYSIALMSPPAISRVGNQFWSSGGAGVAEDGLVSAPFSNPASSNPKTLTLSFETGIRSTADFSLGANYDGRLIVPSYASLSTPGQEWNMSLGYADIYDLDISIRGISVTTEANPDGTGQTYDYERSVLAHAFFGSARFQASPIFSVGLTMGLNLVKSSEYFARMTAKGQGYGLVAVVGALFKPSSDLSLGSKVTFASTVRSEQQFTSSVIRVQPRSGFYVIESSIYRTAFPLTAEAGFDWKLSSSTRFPASVEFQRWSGVSAGYDNIWQFHLGTIISIVPAASIRVGFFTQEDPSSFSQRYMNENFLTMGFEISAGDHVALSASILDSHLFSSSDAVPTLESPSHQFRRMSASVGGSYSF